MGHGDNAVRYRLGRALHTAVALLPTPALEWDLPFGANGLGQIFAVPAVIVIATPLSVLTGASPRLPQQMPRLYCFVPIFRFQRFRTLTSGKFDMHANLLMQLAFRNL